MLTDIKEPVSLLLASRDVSPHSIEVLKHGSRKEDIELCIFASHSMLSYRGGQCLITYPTLQAAIECLVYKQVLPEIANLIGWSDRTQICVYVGDSHLATFTLDFMNGALND